MITHIQVTAQQQVYHELFGIIKMPLKGLDTQQVYPLTSRSLRLRNMRSVEHDYLEKGVCEGVCQG